MAKVSMDDIKKLRAMTSAGMGLCKECLVKADGDFDKAIELINKRSDVINRLRNLTGAKIGLAKIALEDAGKDFEKAVELINERGWDNPIGDTEGTKEGIIGVYAHGSDSRTVALVEVQSSTDFVARNDDFKEFVNELAIQVAAMKPKYVSKDSIPKEDIKKLKETFKKELEGDKKPKDILEKIIEGKFTKYYAENCLLEQTWLKDENKKMQVLFDEAVQKMGEPLEITRLLVWELGK